MVKVTSLSEKEILEVGNAFANYNYAGGERGMYAYYKNHDAVRDYICDYAKAVMKRGLLYSTSDNHEAYISFRTSDVRMFNATGPGIIASLIRNMGFFGALGFVGRLLSAGEAYDSKLRKQFKGRGKEFIVVGLLAVTEPYQGQGYMRKVLNIAFEEGRKRHCPVYLETDGIEKRNKYMSLGMELVGTRKISDGSYLYDLVKMP